MRYRVLIADDDAGRCRLLKDSIADCGHSPVVAATAWDALDRLQDARQFDAFVLDMIMPDLDGMAVMERLKRRDSPPPPIIAMIESSRPDLARTAIRLGATDYLMPPFTTERLAVTLRNSVEMRRLQLDIERRNPLGRELRFQELVADSPGMKRAIGRARQAAAGDVPILIEGEPGTGKTTVARALHAKSRRRSGPFVAFDCQRPARESGRFESEVWPQTLARAARGSLYLTHLECLPMACQADLVDRIQASASGDVGGPFRLIVSSTRRLVEESAGERVHPRLFNLLNVMPLWLPPLHERNDDIPVLADRFRIRFAAEAGRPGIYGISEDALGGLQAVRWPDNVRGLARATSQAVMLARGAMLERNDFPSVAFAETGSAGSDRLSVLADADADLNRQLPVAIGRQVDPEAYRDPQRPADRHKRPPYHSLALLQESGEIRSLRALERDAINFGMSHYGGRLSEVARRLGIGRSTLYRKLKDYGIA